MSTISCSGDGRKHGFTIRRLESAESFSINAQGPYVREVGQAYEFTPVYNLQFIDIESVKPSVDFHHYGVICVRAQYIAPEVMQSLPERPTWAWLVEREQEQEAERKAIAEREERARAARRAEIARTCVAIESTLALEAELIGTEYDVPDAAGGAIRYRIVGNRSAGRSDGLLHRWHWQEGWVAGTSPIHPRATLILGVIQVGPVKRVERPLPALVELGDED